MSVIIEEDKFVPDAWDAWDAWDAGNMLEASGVRLTLCYHAIDSHHDSSHHNFAIIAFSYRRCQRLDLDRRAIIIAGQNILTSLAPSFGRIGSRTRLTDLRCVRCARCPATANWSRTIQAVPWQYATVLSVTRCSSPSSIT